MVVLEDYFSFGRQKKLVAGRVHRWLSYTVTIVREFSRAGSELLLLQRWSFQQV